MTKSISLDSFDDIRSLVRSFPGPCQDALTAVGLREPKLTKPAGSLGRLEELSLWAAAWQHARRPRADHVVCHIFAGNHGIAAHNLSAFPPEVTEQMVAGFNKGHASINQLCGTFGIEVKVHPIRLDHPTGDFTLCPAMTEEECIEAINIGIQAIEPGTDLVLLGEMGIGNTTSASALACALFGGMASLWTGRGSGIDDPALRRKRAVIETGLARHLSRDPLEVLRCFGGRELAAIMGAVIGARLQQVPVMLDGLICTAAAAPLNLLSGNALDHCKVAHTSAEPGHRLLLEQLGQRGLLDLDMRLGEASGAALAAALVKAAVNCHNNIATFEEAGVSPQLDKGYAHAV